MTAGAQPSAVCPSCAASVALGVLNCPHCGSTQPGGGIPSGAGEPSGRKQGSYSPSDPDPTRATPQRDYGSTVRPDATGSQDAASGPHFGQAGGHSGPQPHYGDGQPPYGGGPAPYPGGAFPGGQAPYGQSPYGAAAPGGGQWYPPAQPIVVYAPKSAGLAILLSFLWLGAGNIYAGQTGLGVALVIVDFLLWLISLAVITLIITVPLWILFFIVALVTSTQAVSSYNSRLTQRY